MAPGQKQTPTRPKHFPWIPKKQGIIKKRHCSHTINWGTTIKMLKIIPMLRPLVHGVQNMIVIT